MKKAFAIYNQTKQNGLRLIVNAVGILTSSNILDSLIQRISKLLAMNAFTIGSPNHPNKIAHPDNQRLAQNNTYLPPSFLYIRSNCLSHPSRINTNTRGNFSLPLAFHLCKCTSKQQIGTTMSNLWLHDLTRMSSTPSERLPNLTYCFQKVHIINLNKGAFLCLKNILSL